MNVASKELCEELYEVSGWQTEKYVQTVNRDMPSEYVRICEFEDDETLDDVGADCYAYDLGYLLRKLQAIDDPVLTEHKGNIYVTLTVNKGYSNIYAERGISEIGYDQRIQPALPSCDADIPENAACKLSIELFKQGVLVK